MVSCEISSSELPLLSQLRSVHVPPSHAPCLIDQLSHQFCGSCPSLFPLRVTCGDPPDRCLCALLSVLSFGTASWLKVKKSIISSALDPRSDEQEEEYPKTCQGLERHTTTATGKIIKDAIYYSTDLRKVQETGFLNSGKLDLMPLFLTTLKQPTVLKEL